MPITGIPLTDSQLFDTINVVVPAWLLLALAPRWRHSQNLSAVAALYCSLLYTALMVSMMLSPSDGGGVDFGDMFTLDGVTRLLAKKGTALPCWVHFAAFDLWVGRWMAADSVERGVPQLLLIPCLFTCLMLGPAGLVVYFLLRTMFNKAPAVTGGRGRKGKTA